MAVVEWLDQCDEQTLFLSVLTLGELQKGISKLPAGRKKDELQAWAEFDLTARFEGRILDLDRETAFAWGRLIGESERQGVKLPVMDSLIAATATVHGLVVVTRNVQDLERCRARVFNPWEM